MNTNGIKHQSSFAIKEIAREKKYTKQHRQLDSVSDKGGTRKL